VIITAPSGNKIVNPGDVLKCSSVGNPPPSYELMDMMTSQSIASPSAEWTVPDNCNKHKGNQSILILQCTAKVNSLGKVSASTVSKTFTAVNEKCTETSYGIVHEIYLNMLFLIYLAFVGIISQ
jgi:hypothetical protein